MIINLSGTDLDAVGARKVAARMATIYVRDPNLNLVDIAFLLGFSEQSAFQRAFKRWTGMPPGHYRKSF